MDGGRASQWGERPPGATRRPSVERDRTEGPPILLVALAFAAVVGLFVVPNVPHYPFHAPLEGGTKPTVGLSAGTWNVQTLAISIVSLSTTTLDVPALTFIIVAPDGTVYFNGGQGTQTQAGAVTVTVSYVNGAPEDPAKVDHGDHIELVVADDFGVSRLHGTSFKLMQGTDTLGTVQVP